MTSSTPHRHDGQGKHDHWLVRPRTIRLLWRLFAIILALTVLAQALIDVHGHFGPDGWFGFNAAYGFASCVVMIVVARALGGLLKRPDDYYIEPTELAPSAMPDGKDGDDDA